MRALGGRMWLPSTEMEKEVRVAFRGKTQNPQVARAIAQAKHDEVLNQVLEGMKTWRQIKETLKVTSRWHSCCVTGLSHS